MILISNETKYTNKPFTIQSDVPLSSIAASNFDLKVYNNETYSTITLSNSNIIVTNNTSAGIYTIDIDIVTLPYKNYMLTAFSIPSSGGYGRVEVQVFRFLSVYQKDETATTNNNNVYTQLKWMNNVLSSEYLLKNQQDYTQIFNPTDYNFETGKYETSNELVSVKNNELILNNLISQYFTEYKTFYESINQRTSPTYNDDYINNLHLTFMNNMVKWNSLKGTKFYIELMVGLYAKYLGYNILSVVEDLVHNFTYRVSTSIPKELWNKHIKPYVHPLSWNSIYSEVDSYIHGPYWQIIDRAKMMRELWAIDTIAFLDAEFYSKDANVHFRNLKNLYHSSGNIEVYNEDTHREHYHTNCTFQSKYDQYKFNKNFNGFVSDVQFAIRDVSLLYKQLKDISNIRYHLDRYNQTMTLDFGLPGVAHEYIREIYNQNQIEDISASPLSKVTINVHENSSVLLRLKRNTWNQYINKVDQSPFFQYKTLPLSFACYHNKNKFLNMGDDTKIFEYNNMAVINFTTHYNHDALSTVNDFDYTFTSETLSGMFDDPNNFLITKESSATFNNDVYYKTKFVFPKAGIIQKYDWSLYINDILIDTTTTYFDNVSFNIRSDDYTSSKVGLKIYYKNGSYTLNNTANCV